MRGLLRILRAEVTLNDMFTQRLSADIENADAVFFLWEGDASFPVRWENAVWQSDASRLARLLPEKDFRDLVIYYRLL